MRACILPEFSQDEVAHALATHYDLTGTLRQLDGERDLNYLLTTAHGRYVFKIAGRDESQEMLACQHAVFERLHAAGQAKGTPRSVLSRAHKPLECIRSADNQTHYCRLVTYVEGRLLSAVKPHTDDLLYSLGERVAELGRCLEGFEHAALERELLWHTQQGADVVARFSPLVTEPHRRQLLALFSRRFTDRITDTGAVLRRGVIHNDANDNNVLVGGSGAWQQRVVGLIDYGDMAYGWVATDAAIAAAYAMLGKAQPLDAACQVVRGFHHRKALTEAEIRTLFELICMRLCMSVSICAWQQSLNPDNPYLRISEQPAWRLLEMLAEIPPDYAHFLLRDACGLPPVPQAADVVAWCHAHQREFRGIVEPDLATAPLLVLDTGVSSPLLDNPAIAYDAEATTRQLFRALDDYGCRAAIGLYAEYRLIYHGDAFTDTTGHQRTLHLGIDVFMPAGSAVNAPLAGRVHSLANHVAAFDYGGTIILRHEYAHQGRSGVFYTLYGHLRPASFTHLEVGQNIRAGARLAVMGSADENGNWPPHVHVEIITDLLDQADTFVGVGAHAHRNVWLSLCPDPNVILQIPQHILARVRADHPDDGERIRHARTRHLSPSLSLSHRRPIHALRGALQYLYDFSGYRYLDAVNNVAHVGHCHPAVVAAERRQAGVLNTNTRYLHGAITDYSERLLARFPPPLERCFLVNSGSEANDLALRLARCATGANDIIVLEHAYHGHLSALIDISPYKHDAKGGAGTPGYVHKLPLPAGYRQPQGDPVPLLERYAACIDQAIDRANRQGGVAALIAESLLGCGGQVVLPPGYLQQLYAKVRAAGGVCIADEVQVGFGRVGAHFWGFETQQVIPDIVTLGKPIGNGHPLAAVITTERIATAFNNGMEYFNTYGGNPVSCAVGRAVLEVIEADDLQQNALTTGQHLMQQLRQLQPDFELIGDVRGLGLFIGIELVTDQKTAHPATDQAAYIAERMKQEGVLVGVDGPQRNVLKIKPPMCFNKANADQLVERLGWILQEDYAQADTVRFGVV